MRKEYNETGGINMYVIKHKTNKYVNLKKKSCLA